MKTVMFSHLDALILHFEKYFSQGFTSLKVEQFIDLSSDLTLKNLYNLNLLILFWVKARSEFPLVCCKALRVLVPFATSYLCKAGFSAAAVFKYRNKD